jgi:hypothetical protein
MSGLYTVAFLSFALGVCTGQTADMTGTWQLNLEKSAWGSRPKPISVTLHIEHKEPALKYSGTVMYAGEETRPFSFNGGIDGREYHMDRSFGTGTVVLHRVDPYSFESVFRTKDGSSVETTRTSIAQNRRTLTRRIRLQTAAGTTTSTEVYDRF